MPDTLRPPPRVPKRAPSEGPAACRGSPCPDIESLRAGDPCPRPHLCLAPPPHPCTPTWPWLSGPAPHPPQPPVPPPQPCCLYGSLGHMLLLQPCESLPAVCGDRAWLGGRVGPEGGPQDPSPRDAERVLLDAQGPHLLHWSVTPPTGSGPPEQLRGPFASSMQAAPEDALTSRHRRPVPARGAASFWGGWGGDSSDGLLVLSALGLQVLSEGAPGLPQPEIIGLCAPMARAGGEER